MPVPTVANCWRITYTMTIGTPQYTAENVVHGFAPWTADPQLVANEAGGAWVVTGSFRGLQSSTVTLQNVIVQPFDGVSAPLTMSVSGYTGVQGLGSVNTVPANSSMIITKRTPLSGRAYRGRMYIAGLVQTSIDVGGSQWTTGTVNSWNTAAAAFRTKFESGPTLSRLLVYSPHHGTATGVSALVARQYIGTQRRRSSPY